jgi:aminoglycoside/choline kinase family phosphotransferase
MNPEFDVSLMPPRLRHELQAWDVIQPLAADGSDRQFYRLKRSGDSLICLYHPHPPGDPVTENDSYDAIGRHLRERGAPVPDIFTYCREEGWFLVQDLGDRLLQEHYRRQTEAESQLVLYGQALEALVDMQVLGTPGFSPAWCFDTPDYDADLVRHRECHYFVQAFVQGYLGLETRPEELSEDFELLLQRALYPRQKFLVHRDFQSRNLMVHQNRLWLIDFQGARLGPQQYDVAALLLDPYVNLSHSTQETLLAHYLVLLQEHLPVDPAVWRQKYDYVSLCRNLQILGAYGFLSRQKGKPFFQQFIPAACRSLQHRLESLPSGDFPELRRIVHRAAARLQALRTQCG